MLYLTLHLCGLFIWVSALTAQLFTFYSDNSITKNLRKKLWIYWVIPGTILFTIGAIFLVIEEDYNFFSEHWLLGKWLFLIMLIVADILIQKKGETLNNMTPEVMHSFIKKMIITILIAIVGAVSLAMWHKENEDKNEWKEKQESAITATYLLHV